MARNLICKGIIHVMTTELEISFQVANKDFKWEPLIRQYIRIEKGVILEQDKLTDFMYFKVSFPKEENKQTFSDNLKDIGIKLSA